FQETMRSVSAASIATLVCHARPDRPTVTCDISSPSLRYTVRTRGLPRSMVAVFASFTFSVRTGAATVDNDDTRHAIHPAIITSRAPNSTNAARAIRLIAVKAAALLCFPINVADTPPEVLVSHHSPGSAE